MVIDDANKNPRFECFGYTCAIGGAAVHREDQLNSVFQCGSDRPFGDAVTIAVALRDVPLSDRANRAEGSDHDRCACQTIRIKIADHKDRLPLLACGT